MREREREGIRISLFSLCMYVGGEDEERKDEFSYVCNCTNVNRGHDNFQLSAQVFVLMLIMLSIAESIYVKVNVKQLK